MRVCGRCDSMCAPSAIWCITCGGALLPPAAMREARARMAQASRGPTRRYWRACPYCGTKCRGRTCRDCNDLPALEPA